MGSVARARRAFTRRLSAPPGSGLAGVGAIGGYSAGASSKQILGVRAPVVDALASHGRSSAAFLGLLRAAFSGLSYRLFFGVWDFFTSFPLRPTHD